MTVVLLDPRRPTLVPVEAVALLTGPVACTEELPAPWALPDSDAAAPVLVSSDRDHPAVVARLAAGEPLITVPDAPAGDRLIDAVAMMDRLRAAGPWEAEQTHDSLCRFLLEETYELFDAVRDGNPEDLCGELGDVLLQVLFHARIAQESADRPFGIDDVADALLRKLANRVPAVLAGEQISLADQLAQWEERKALEKTRDSIMDDLSTAQPALALAQKVLGRAAKAGFPAELIPAALTTVVISADSDAENRLRHAVLEFIDAVRGAEQRIEFARDGQRGTPTEWEWRTHFPESG
ncbi:nucleoside triphosphate pyrophosphohydrolase [Mycobacterium sp. M1]|uniref:Nucleoside triphosphate pyrophosphohydrolase n=1 Tax=Mycolicibacter acidiphilus TaxID=2835306 RepID=A0ABS5RPQ6_9MYCO|nr:nucleoside triphosphate pyrophosphohydrolase [Mycolicibacter acidiphilus]MBS9536022.1 nucleoside triphosphate pyrophosphohydrolase [Mycolicibacter acidiphilus]